MAALADARDDDAATGRPDNGDSLGEGFGQAAVECRVERGEAGALGFDRAAAGGDRLLGRKRSVAKVSKG
jgi:hypothetical protein